MASTSSDLHNDEEGVYQLLTQLCYKTASNYNLSNKITTKQLASRMRSHSYDILLKRLANEVPTSKRGIVSDLMYHYFTNLSRAKNVAEHSRCIELKNIVSSLKVKEFGANKEDIHNILKLLVSLSNTEKDDYSEELYKKPFSFGLLDQMLPKPPRESFKSPDPYSYYPDHVFELPYSLRNKADSEFKKKTSMTYTEYTVESFDSRSMISDNMDVKKIFSPLSVNAMSEPSLHFPVTSMFPRLTAPRDLQIPTIKSSRFHEEGTVENVQSDVNVISISDTSLEIVDIWELARQVDKDIPDDIWEIVSKMPMVNNRELIASSGRELSIWRQIYQGRMTELNVISEKQFIRHITYLLIGIETKSFPFNHESSWFYMNRNLILEGVSMEHIRGYVSDLLLIGTYYRRLFNFAFNTTLEDHFHEKGLVFESSRDIVRRYLLQFRLKTTEMCDGCFKETNANCLPTLLQILHHMEPLKYEIETIASIYKMIELEPKCSIPYGAELMSYLYNEISLVTHKGTSCTMLNALHSICTVYFKFIERFIFEGELEDTYNEFFIRKDSQYVNCRSKRYWDKGFHISQSVAVPEFLRSLAKCILLCGKSLRLLKLCNPRDPLVLLITSDHPSIRCCSSFEALERQQQILTVYRTRCRFVSGEPAVFERILLKREAERKAFAELASLKQAETLDKIIADRKRLAQLIIAEKQHSLRVLEAAMAEAQAAKSKSKHREKLRTDIERERERACEEVDARLKDDEKNKVMEYYSKLNMEVEKSKIHTEWKIKRLQLDQSRMQLLSSEERFFKREKIEKELQRNEETMSMSIRSDDDGISSDYYDTVSTEQTKSEMDVKAADSQHFSQARSDPAIGTQDCDNAKVLDAQGNVVFIGTNDREQKLLESSSYVIGGHLHEINDNIEYLRVRNEAASNKQKVLAHEFDTDIQNNPLQLPLLKLESFDEENNLQFGLTTYQEAKRNKLKVLSAESERILPATITTLLEPRTDALKEAKINKQKVLGIEYNLQLEETPRREPANIAQEEAMINRQKVLGVEFNLPPEDIFKRIPANVAQEEAVMNKQRVLGVEFNLPLEAIQKRNPANIAQEEALVNRDKVMGIEYNLPLKPLTKKEPTTLAQEEAVANRVKILGVESDLPLKPALKRVPSNIAQEEAVSNKDKVLGAVFHLPSETYVRKEPANSAQEDAIRNRSNMIRSDYDDRPPEFGSKNATSKRSGLTLNLKSCTDAYSLGVTPNTGAITPAEFFPRLDLETPTTTDNPLEAQLTGDLTPHSEYERPPQTNEDKQFLNADGFNFALMVDEATNECEDQELDGIISPSNQPKSESSSLFNALEGSYRLEDFDPFGMKEFKTYSGDYFSRKLDSDMRSSCYTHPALIMQEVRKKPDNSIFMSQIGSCEEEESNITCDNIATMTACLQRSVMLPLTYQLEVVNNSILTYFLVNLDMYEHLKSLKDYFFLMDGEFSRSICHNLFSKLVKTANPQELLNFATLHNILDKALGSSISHVHKFSENLSFTISETPLSFLHSSPDVLQCLSLTYLVSWPLNIILSQEALLRYAKVFQFLVKMRRISWVLGEDFKELKLCAKLSNKDSRTLLRSPQYIKVQLYRHTMASLIRALDNYIVTTCILTSWTEFENDLKKARTLDDLYECHVVYIKKVLFRCLLNNRSTPVMKLLNDIFIVILKFSRVLKAGNWQINVTCNSFIHTNFTQLEELFHLFEKLAKYLYKVVTRLMECGYQRHLAELLTLVNLNGYYNSEKSTAEHNNSIHSNR